MRGLLAIAAVAMVSIFAAITNDRVGPPSAYAPSGVGEWDAAVTQANIAKTICKPDYTAVVRSGKGAEFGAITESIKKQVYARDGKSPDGLPRAQSICCEIDHYYPLELGGANAIANLWAESWAHPFGAHDKDLVETALHRMVCRAENPVTLEFARKCLADDWVACGRKIGALSP